MYNYMPHNKLDTKALENWLWEEHINTSCGNSPKVLVKVQANSILLARLPS